MAELLKFDADRIGAATIVETDNLRAYLAEFIGTLLFVAMGSAAVIVAGVVSGGADVVWIAAAHGLALAGMMYLTIHVSGGHLNPAVTLGMMIAGRTKVVPGLVYIAAQLAGACLATAVLYVALRDAIGNGDAVGASIDFGAHSINSAAVDGDGGALLLEIVLTMALVLVFFSATRSKRGAGSLAPLAVGLTYMAVQLVAWPLTGGSVNPARTLGPALVSDAFDSFWVYVLGPAAGAALAALIYYVGFANGDAGDE